MNRRELILGCGAAAVGVAAAGVAFPKSIHPAIQANMDYWKDRMLDDPPYHTSYYGIKEDGALRVYAVKWNGTDVKQATVFIPDHERELLAELNKARAKSYGDIGDTLPKMLNGQDCVIDCFVYNSPVRKQPRWMPSIATSLLKEAG